MSEATSKQGAITSKDLGGGKRFHVPGLRGSFKDAVFNDDCTTEQPVSASTEKALKEMFGKGVQEVKDATKSADSGQGGAQ